MPGRFAPTWEKSAAAAASGVSSAIQVPLYELEHDEHS